MRKFLLAGLVVGMGLFSFGQSANAAPQILAALPTSVGIPFTCREGQCQADLSTYCLQQDRPTPSHGAVYHPAAAEDFKLVIRTTAGSTTVNAVPHVRFIESRGFMAVAAIIPEATLQDLGGTDAVITVGNAASLLPEPTRHDPNPLTEKEIAYVTKWRRDQGAGMVDVTPKAKAAQVLANVANRLPRRGATVPETLDGIWEQAIGDELGSAPAEIVTPALTRARLEFKNCRDGGARYSFGGVRRCLEYRHDDMIRDLNIDFWNSKPGS